MSKKLILVFVGVIFFSSCHLVFASLTINEIMYDLSGSDSTLNKSREWIEIYNPDASDVSIDASKWRIYDGSDNRTINNQTDFTIPADSYVIFAGDKDTFLADNPSFTGTVYDTGITSLNNTGATIKLLDQDGNVVDSVTYTSSEGAAGDGNSLQLVNGSWISAAPTPGLANSVETTTPDNPVIVSDPDGGSSSDGNSGGGSSGSSVNSSNSTSFYSSSVTKNKTVTEYKIKTTIVTKNFGFVDVPLSLEATTLGSIGEQLYSGEYFLSFGDGDSTEMKYPESQSFTHTYFYPGEYIISLSHYVNNYSDTVAPDSSDQATVKIVPTDISISNVGDEKDFFVEITNNTDYDADLSNWILASAQKSFKFPPNTVIISKHKIIVPSKITNFSIESKNTLKLLSPEGDIISDYASSTVPIATANTDVSKAFSPSRIVSTSTKNKNSIQAEEIPTENLPAAALEGGVQDTSNSHATIIFIIFIIFIGASSYSIYFIRQKKVVPKDGDDFEILDE